VPYHKLLLNSSIMAVSLPFAASAHARLNQQGQCDDLLTLLQRYSLPRLLASAASTTILAILAVQSLAT
jgi:hypothetical protein